MCSIVPLLLKCKFKKTIWWSHKVFFLAITFKDNIFIFFKNTPFSLSYYDFKIIRILNNKKEVKEVTKNISPWRYLKTICLNTHSFINCCFVLFLVLVNSSRDWFRLCTVPLPVSPSIKFVSLTATWLSITGVTLLADTFKRTVGIGAICI